MKRTPIGRPHRIWGYLRQYRENKGYKMTSSYIRKFKPDKLHLISAALLLIALIFFISGAYRAFRITNCTELADISYESDIHKNDSLVFSAQPVRRVLNQASKENNIVCAQVSKGIISDYEILVVNFAGKYRYVAVEKDSEEYNRFLNSEEVTGYFSDKYSNDFLEYISGMDDYYDEKSVIPENECSAMGIIIVDRKQETLSFLWGLPFLAAGLLLLLKAGSPYFYVPEDTPDNKTENK